LERGQNPCFAALAIYFVKLYHHEVAALVEVDNWVAKTAVAAADSEHVWREGSLGL